MTSPRSSYGGGYYAAPSYPETPIYDMLVAERGTPQIAPIRVPSVYESHSALPALPAPRPALDPAPAALPPGGGHTSAPPPPAGYGQQAPAAQPPLQQPQMPHPQMQQAVPLQQAPAPYAAQQAPQPQMQQGGYVNQRQQPAPQPYPQQQQQAPQPQMQPVAPPRPAPPRQMGYDDPYGGQPYPGRGY